MYKNLKFHTVKDVSQKLRVSEEFIMGLINKNILEAVAIKDTDIWLINEKSILSLLSKGNNLGKSYDDDFYSKNFGKENKTTLNTESNNFNEKKKVICEFIFDEEQTKKPVSEKIIFLKSIVSGKEESNKAVLKGNPKENGVWKEFNKEVKVESKKNKRGRPKGSKKVRKTFMLHKHIINQLDLFKNNGENTMSKIVEQALMMYFEKEH